MTPAFRAIFVAVLLVLSFALPIAAGTLEDGIAAYDKGDYETALRLLLANQSNSAAQFLLADMYTKGQGVPQDLVEGISWYRKAADQGGAEAQNRLGFIYGQGLGVPQDYSEAIKWCHKAADQGNADAQHNLGFMYSHGQGVQQSYTEAVKWYRKAADQGNAYAQSLLAMMYRDGHGLAQDYVEAHKWFNLAASKLSPSDETQAGLRNLAEQGRAAVAAKMTPAQIAEAQKLAREWKPTTQPSRYRK